MKRVWALAAAMVVAWGVSATAEPMPVSPASTPTAPTAPSPPETLAAPAAPAPGQLTLPADTLVRVELGEPVSSKTGKRGDKFALRLAAPIVVGGFIVAPAGATGQGEIVYAEPGHGGGAPGKLVLAARYVEVGGQRITLKAFHLGSGGDDQFTRLQVASELIGPAVMFVNGQDVVYPAGVKANAKVAADIALPQGPPAPGAPAPAASPVPPAPAATPAQPSAS